MKSRPHAVPLPRRRDQWRTLTAHWCCEHTSARPASSLAKTTQASRGPGRTESPRWSPRCTGPVPGAGSARQGPLFNVPKPWDGVSDCHDVPDPRTTVRRRRRLWGRGGRAGHPPGSLSWRTRLGEALQRDHRPSATAAQTSATWHRGFKHKESSFNTFLFTF